MTSEAEIAADLTDYLQEDPGVCAEGGAHGWRWIRFHESEWKATKYASRGDRKKTYVVGEILTREAVRDWLMQNPATLIPASKAYQWSPSNRTVWAHADRQDVFSDFNRCFWCGSSEQNRELTVANTTEDGECPLCPECLDSWRRDGQIEQVVGVVEQTESGGNHE